MPSSRTINFILILVGGIIALYANSEEDQNMYILLAGIMVLMVGLYRLSRGIPSKTDDSENFIKEEEE